MTLNKFSETLVKGKIIDSVINFETGLVSSVTKEVNTTGLMVAYGLVNIENDIIPVKLMNVINKECDVKKNTIYRS